MSFLTFIKLLSVLTFASVQAVDWCSLQYCSANQHIACGHSGFSELCTDLQFTENVGSFVRTKQTLLDQQNAYRNQVATGQLPRFSTARKMAKVRWNDQLAFIAELNTKQCEMRHDACRNTPTFRFSGQNLAWMATTGTYTAEQVFNIALPMWFNEHQHASMNDINNFQSVTSPSGVIGHFTALVVDRTTDIGCGISTYRYLSGSTWFNAYLMACNYASTNMIGCSIYKTGSPASSCSQGPDSRFPGLCSLSEPIDANVLC